MNKNYMLRGIGIGIIIGVMIMYAAYATIGKKSAGPSETKKAEATTEATTTEEKTTEKTTEKVTEATTEKVTEATTEEKTEKTTEKTTEATTEKTTEEKTEATTEKKTEATTEKEEVTTEKKTEEKKEEKKEDKTEKKEEKTESKEKEDSSKGKTQKITITTGMGSETISDILAKAGLVKSASEYNTWLIEKGYDSKLHVGTFEIKEGASYEEIAKILTTQGK